MTNEFAKAEIAALVEEFQAQMATLADVQKQRSRIMATGTALNRRVTVVVNADGVVIETRFDDDLDLPLHELAEAVTEAAQAAAVELTRKNTELMNPVKERHGRMPKMSDLIEGLPDLSELIPGSIPAPISPPNSRERQDDFEPTMVFTDVEVIDERAPGQISDTRW